MELTSALLISAFVAGVVMFLAPCTLPLIPAYLGFISGVSYSELNNPRMVALVRKKVVKNSIFFVLGFSGIFILFGLLAGFISLYVGPLRGALSKVAGELIILFGLLLIGAVRPSFLMRERRITPPRFLTLGSPWSSFLLGAAFAFGWTPCIGPILGTVLLFASTTETVGAGALLLVVFSCGFSLPFIALAYFISCAGTFTARIAPYLQGVSIIGGVFLILLGVFMLVGDVAYFTTWLFRILAWLDYEQYLMRFL